MSFTVTAVPIEHLADAWHRAVRWLKPAVDRSGGRFDMKALFFAVKAQKSILWLVLRDADGAVVAAMTTHIARYPLKDILTVDFIGGSDVDDWLASADEVLVRYVTAHQLAGLETVARHGWKPRLAALGWVQPMAWYDKPASGAEQG